MRALLLGLIASTFLVPKAFSLCVEPQGGHIYDYCTSIVVAEIENVAQSEHLHDLVDTLDESTIVTRYDFRIREVLAGEAQVDSTASAYRCGSTSWIDENGLDMTVECADAIGPLEVGQQYVLFVGAEHGLPWMSQCFGGAYRIDDFGGGDVFVRPVIGQHADRTPSYGQAGPIEALRAEIEAWSQR